MLVKIDFLSSLECWETLRQLTCNIHLYPLVLAFKRLSKVGQLSQCICICVVYILFDIAISFKNDNN